jgi:hypothetical protein
MFYELQYLWNKIYKTAKQKLYFEQIIETNEQLFVCFYSLLYVQFFCYVV